MYLKSIEVNGFKSFANKIVFKFNHGITCIVGPNGSGKSNVGDAVRWVLGEQSAKSLRGSKMEDVIFSGTELRKPQGSAYVAITLDNSDHSLPVDYNEVTVARRVYRSGESEYLINGTVSRLKDVHSLFFDTGIGKEGYSIIGQGQIEKILNGKPEERRELFDEAAGIVKFKKNKLAAEKSLETERDNLNRVNDILYELEKQVGPLKAQSEKARKYLAYKEELKKFDINAYLIEEKEIKEGIEKQTADLNIINDDLAEKNQAYDSTKEEYEKIEQTIEELNELIESVKNDIHEKEMENQKLTGDIGILDQQIINYRMNDENINDQIKRLEKQIEDSKAAILSYIDQKNGLLEKKNASDNDLSEAKKKSAGISADIEKMEQEIEDCKSDIIEYISESGSVKAKVGRYDAMLENINFRKTKLNQRFLQFKSDEAHDRQEYNKLNSDLETLEAQIEEKVSRLNEVEKQLAYNQERNKENRLLIHNTNEKLSATKSKREALRNITERYDGYGNSIKKVMEQKTNNPGILGVVADLISVNRDYEIAVETALGGSIQNIVTEDDTTAKKMIAYLKNNRLGRATFLPLNNISDRGSVRSEVLSERGVIGVASELVTVDKKYEPLAKNLLGRIIVADNIDNALAVARKYNHTLRIVTLEGELLNPGGSLTGGAYRNNSNLLGRKRELDELKQLINKLNKTALDASRLDEELKTQRESFRAEIDSLNVYLQKAYIEKNTLTLNIEQVSSRLSESNNAFSSIQKEINELNNQVIEINSNKSKLYDDSKKHEDAKASCEERINELTEKIAKEREALTGANEKVSTLLVDNNAITQQEEFITSNISRIKQDIDSYTREKEDYMSRLTEKSQEIKKLDEDITHYKELIEDNNAVLKQDSEKLESYNKDREENINRNKEFFNRREELSKSISGLEKAAYKLNSLIEKNTEKSDALNNYMWEEYEITYSSALPMFDEDLQDLNSLKKEIGAIKSKIKSLGDVNVNSIEDYKEVSERYEFLKGQHDDIVAAEHNLISVINDLDKAMQEQFALKFKEIQTMFDKVFKELFGGGKGELELVDDTNLLETGIRIIAQPPGKKLQNMMQLSGGEKSLTAIALLFAIQSLKPSPFCLLDEIEAALDDSNVRRFAKYLNRLTKDTQFIVISHRKGTMEAADILYGITMQEKGVSTLVSVNMIEGDLDK